MDTIYLQEIKAATFGPRHHLFGFHDLPAWNYEGDRLVSLEVENINTPPDPSIACRLGYATNDGTFVKFGCTHAFNYPQGARQQWINGTNMVIVNDLGKNKFISKVYNTDNGKIVRILEYPTHCIANDGWAYGLDYARLSRLGAYGYAGVDDPGAFDHTPSQTGIDAHNISTKEHKLLLSVKEVALLHKNPNSGYQHYITHLLLSPDQKRIAFLHRFKLKDGGETTRLCTIGRDGSGLRCLAEGFLSHFDWKDNNNIMIWGRIGTGIEKFRGSLIYRMVPRQLTRFSKQVIKNMTSNNGNMGKPGFHWLCISDNDTHEFFYIGNDILTRDGHPMYCPVNRNWFVSDTYPDKEGIRTLFLYNITQKLKVELGHFKMINDKPDKEKSRHLLKGIDSEVVKTVGTEKITFTRSGLHCDLHPRWSPDGKKIAFDSIHEGTRQIYTCNVKGIMNNH